MSDDSERQESNLKEYEQFFAPKLAFCHSHFWGDVLNMHTNWKESLRDELVLEVWREFKKQVPVDLYELFEGMVETGEVQTVIDLDDEYINVMIMWRRHRGSN